MVGQFVYEGHYWTQDACVVYTIVVTMLHQAMLSGPIGNELLQKY